MSATRRLGRVALAALALSAATVSPPATADPALPGQPDSCRVVAFSPTVQSDGTGMCVGYLVDRTYTAGDFTLSYLVYVTVDKGRTWTPAAGAGLVANDFSHLGGVAFSAAYATDHAVYLQSTEQGVMVSTDLGQSWRPYDSAATQWADAVAVTKAVTPPGLPQLGASAVVVAGGDESDQVSISQGMTHVPATGSPADDRQLLVPAAFPEVPAFSLADVRAGDGNSTWTRAALFQCDRTMLCQEQLFAFPAGTAAERAWLSPDFASNKTMYVTLRSPAARQQLQAWISTDGGHRFSRWKSVDALLATANAQGGQTTSLGLAMAAGSRTFYAHVSTVPHYPTTHRSAVPWQQVFRSTDRGTRWQRVATGTPGKDFKPVGNLPNYLPHGLDRRHTGDIWMLPDGRVFVSGGVIDLLPPGVFVWNFGLWCSVDGGATWARACKS